MVTGPKRHGGRGRDELIISGHNVFRAPYHHPLRTSVDHGPLMNGAFRWRNAVLAGGPGG